MIHMFYLFYTSTLASEALQTSYNNFLKETYGYERAEVHDVEEFFEKKDKTDLEKILFENLEEINSQCRPVVSFNVEDEIEGLQRAMNNCMMTIKKNEKLSKEQAFFWYMQIENAIYCSGPGLSSEKVDVVPNNISSTTDYIEYELLNLTDGQKKDPKFETEKSEYDNLKKSYQLKFAINIEMVENNGRKSIRLHTNQYLKGFDQDILLSKIYRFKDGLIGYYRSYNFNLKVFDYYTKKQYVDKAGWHTPYSLEALRNIYPGYENYIPDIYTIKDHHDFKNFYIDSIGTLPIMQWICNQNPFQYFKHEKQDKQKAQKLLNELKLHYYKEIVSSAILSNILGKDEIIFNTFFPDFIARLRENLLAANIDLNDSDNYKIKKFLMENKKKTKNVSLDEMYTRFSSYNGFVNSLKTLINDLMDRPDDINTLFAKSFIEASEKIIGSYEFLNGTQITSISKFVKDAGMHLKGDKKLYFEKVSNILNNQIKPFEGEFNMLLGEKASNKKFVQDHEKSIAILEDIWKKVQCLNLIKQTTDECSIGKIKKTEEFIKILLRRYKDEISTRNSDVSNTDSTPYILIAHIQMLLTATHSYYCFYMDRAKDLTFENDDFGIDSKMGIDTSKDHSAGVAYQYELQKQCASLKEYLEETYGTYIASSLMLWYDESGRWTRPTYFLAKNHILGNFRKESNFGNPTEPKK